MMVAADGQRERRGRHGAAIGDAAVEQRDQVRNLHPLVLQVDAERAVVQAEGYVGHRE